MLVTWLTSQALMSSSKVERHGASITRYFNSVTARTSHVDIWPYVVVASAASVHHSSSASTRLLLSTKADAAVRACARNSPSTHPPARGSSLSRSREVRVVVGTKLRVTLVGRRAASSSRLPTHCLLPACRTTKDCRCSLKRARVFSLVAGSVAGSVGSVPRRLKVGAGSVASLSFAGGLNTGTWSLSARLDHPLQTCVQEGQPLVRAGSDLEGDDSQGSRRCLQDRHDEEHDAGPAEAMHPADLDAGRPDLACAAALAGRPLVAIAGRVASVGMAGRMEAGCIEPRALVECCGGG